MAWQQLHITAQQEQVEALSDELMLLGAVAVTYTDTHDQALLEPLPGETPVWDHTGVCGLFAEDCNLQQLLPLLQQQFPQLDYQIERIADQDWLRAGQAGFNAVCFAERLWICPSWESKPDGIVVEMDPGLAFGTGAHATTALCLEWLASQALDQKQIIDYGCGSGILAIAALKLGASFAWAVDYDPQALQAAQANANQNRLAPTRLQVMLPEQLEAAVKADIIIANILANPLIELAGRFAEWLVSGGTVVLSGILAEQCESVQHAYAPWFGSWTVSERDGWVRLTAARLTT